MPGTDELRGASPDGQLAVLIDRSKGMESVLSGLRSDIGRLGEVINKIAGDNAVTYERLLARSDANRTAIEVLDKKVEHDRGTSIARDQQQVTMLQAETAEREKQLRDMAERHDREMQGIKAVLEDIKKDLSESRFWNRLLAGGGGVALSVLGSVIVWLLTRGAP